MRSNAKKILIVEDEMNNAVHVKKIIEQINSDIIVIIADNIDKAYSMAMQHSINIFLIDIILDMSKPGDASGIRFARDIRNIPQYKFVPMIFLTSLYDQEMYAYRELHCYGYVEKPFKAESIKKLVTDALEYEGPAQEEKTIFLKKDGIFYPIKPSKIVYIQSNNHRLYFHLADETELSVYYYSCKQFIDEAQSNELLQCSRRTIVNRSYVKSIDYANDLVIMHGNITLEIGLTYKKDFIEAMR